MLYSSTCKLPIVGSDLLSIVNSEWSSKCVKLLVLHDNQAWSGKGAPFEELSKFVLHSIQFQVVEDEDTADLLDQLSMTEDEYIEETKRALTTNGGAEHFAYAIDCDKFTWKKYVSKDMAVKFGCTVLQKVSAFTVFEEIIDKTLQENLDLHMQLKRADQQNNTFTKENEHLKRMLDGLTEKKCEMESSLYSQFLYLLNEKKRRINELQKQFKPSCEGENEQGVNDSDSDPFGSDTELDSEEEKQSSSVALRRDCVVAEEDNICILPKRLRTPCNIESVAGPSGICQNSKDNGSVNKSPLKNSPKKGNVSKKPQVKKLQKFSCVMGKITDSKEQNSSEEDVFMFPKRSKKINSCVELVKPSTSKIKYDSDDEMPLDKAQKVETDSDSTPSGIDPIDVIKTIPVKPSEDISSKVVKSNIEGKNNDITSNNNSGNDSVKSKNTEIIEGPSFNEYSNSTLEMLNQLV